MKKSRINYLKIFRITLLLLIIAYTVLKSIDMGKDMDVYLNASERIFKGENIYEKDAYNYYLYSPLFAILLKPLSLLSFTVGRIIWGLLNLFLAYRLWIIISNLTIKSLNISKKSQKIWTIGLIIISAGFLNHNLILGQITNELVGHH